jgi:hypothetical protein
MLADMDASPVDPRDVTWEESNPVYRVYFWEDTAAVSGADSAWKSHEWRLVGATNVQAALAWATGAVGRGRRFQLFVETLTAAGAGLLLLTESDPISSAL